jgi:hypothetical protein
MIPMPDLTTLAPLKNRLKIPPTNIAADDDLAELITQTSADFHNACNRNSFFNTQYSERRDGQGGQSMLLRNDLIQTVTGVVISGVTVPSSPDGLQPGYVYDNSTVKLVGYSFLRGYGNVLIEYSAGFGAALDDPDFPAEIELAVRDWCEYRYRARPAAGMKSKHMATGETVVYDQEDMPKTTARVVQQYKRKAAAL